MSSTRESRRGRSSVFRFYRLVSTVLLVFAIVLYMLAGFSVLPDGYRYLAAGCLIGSVLVLILMIWRAFSRD